MVIIISSLIFLPLFNWACDFFRSFKFILYVLSFSNQVLTVSKLKFIDTSGFSFFLMKSVIL